MTTIGVLVPTAPGAPSPPTTRPVGRAALTLQAQGITVLFGDTLTREGGAVVMAGLIATADRWVPHTASITALHDRFPSQRRAGAYAEARSILGSLPMGNPPSITLLCRDKAACQDALEGCGVVMPPVVTDPAEFAGALSAWGVGFLKPRFGALGIGVTRVLPGDPLPSVLPGAVPGRCDPAILQRAVPPPTGWAGRSVRALVQRLPGGGWHFCPPVVRQSRTDFVVNAARGASVAPAADVLSAQTQAHIARSCEAICGRIAAQPDGAWVVELGLDLMIDAEGRAVLIEVNSRPRGRLEALAVLDAARFGAAHVAACARPLAYVASLA
ncbi:MAG: glutathione synthase/RimK-type ligase-like ATP-grasp enzyme [Myxococcota bacterium]|jgi:glutathione synthase/RimK-type ligase-like ATP-grasp enzyme